MITWRQVETARLLFTVKGVKESPETGGTGLADAMGPLQDCDITS